VSGPRFQRVLRNGLGCYIRHRCKFVGQSVLSRWPPSPVYNVYCLPSYCPLEHDIDVTVHRDCQWAGCMPRTSSPSSFRVHRHGAGIIATLSLLVILLCLCLDLEISMDSNQTSVARYGCMGCQGPVSYFSTYMAAACHFANSPTCNQSGCSISVVTIQARPFLLLHHICYTPACYITH
jgi:hypothetical protein